MEELTLIIFMPLFFLFGLFVMKRLDRLLDGKQMRYNSVHESQWTPHFMVLPENLPAEKLVSELQLWKDMFPDAQILFLDANSLDAILCFMKRKR